MPRSASRAWSRDELLGLSVTGEVSGAVVTGCLGVGAAASRFGGGSDFRSAQGSGSDSVGLWVG